MSTWLMNSLFRKVAYMQKLTYFSKFDRYFGLKGAQTHLFEDLTKHEKGKRKSFKYIHRELRTDDVLEKATLRALGNLKIGEITYAEFYKIKAKIDDLKKIRFAEHYDSSVKLESDISTTKEREIFKLYDQVIRNERGEIGYKLWRDRIEKDPQARGIIGNL